MSLMLFVDENAGPHQIKIDDGKPMPPDNLFMKQPNGDITHVNISWQSACYRVNVVSILLFLEALYWHINWVTMYSTDKIIYVLCRCNVVHICILVLVQTCHQLRVVFSLIGQGIVYPSVCSCLKVFKLKKFKD